MRFSGSVSSVSRRALMALALVAAFTGVAFAQDPAAPAQPAQQAADGLKMTEDHVILMYQIKAEKAADWEAGWTEIKAKLTASDKPDVKAFGESMHLFKAQLGASPTTLYVFDLDPTSKTFSYDPTKILYYDEATKTLFGDRAATDALYKKVDPKETLAAVPQPVSKLPLSKVGG
jgi:hypothetical protein